MSNLSEVAVQWLEIDLNLQPSGYQAYNTLLRHVKPIIMIIFIAYEAHIYDNIAQCISYVLAIWDYMQDVKPTGVVWGCIVVWASYVVWMMLLLFVTA